MTAECKCGGPSKPVTYEQLISTLRSVRVGGLLLTAAEADNIARRVLMDLVRSDLIDR
jgi:hypothetical protein